MNRPLTALMAAALVLTFASCSSDDSDEPAETTAPAETSEAAEAPDTVDAADPDLSDLDAQQIVAFDEARESALADCLASTGELSQETCVLVWNCAVNEVGVQAAADPAQEAKLDEALDTCTAAIQ